MSSPYIIDGPSEASVSFLFAHGAGAGMDHDFMTAVAQGLASKGIEVIRFNFPYMVQRGIDGKRRPPDRQPKLLMDFAHHIKHFSDRKLVIGGKSMGGRMASVICDESKVLGLACLGFPFHPPKKPEKFRGEHLASIMTPTLILQGDRDTFGNREAVSGFTLSPSVSVEYLADGDHSFHPRKSSGYTDQQHMDTIIKSLAAFIFQCERNKHE